MFQRPLSARHGEVVRHVRSIRKHGQVFDAVVSFVPVGVVNDIGPRKFAPKVSLHHDAMLVFGAVLGENQNVSMAGEPLSSQAVSASSFCALGDGLLGLRHSALSRSRRPLRIFPSDSFYGFGNLRGWAYPALLERGLGSVSRHGVTLCRAGEKYNALFND